MLQYVLQKGYGVGGCSGVTIQLHPEYESLIVAPLKLIRRGLLAAVFSRLIVKVADRDVPPVWF